MLAAMQITVFGSNGRVGSLVVAEALARGYTVVAFIHNHSSLPADSHLKLYKGDAYNPQAVAEAVIGSEAVISTLSSWKNPARNTLSKAMETMVPVLEKARVGRIISLTGADAIAPTEIPPLTNRVTRYFFGHVIKGILQDGDAHIRILSESKLDWTVLRSPVMTPSENRRYALQEAMLPPYISIPRAAVAEALVDQITDPHFVQKVASIHRP